MYFGTSYHLKDDVSNLHWAARRTAVSMPELALLMGHLGNLGYAVVNVELNPLCPHCAEFLMLKIS
jgi:hypothetical protein